MIATATQTGTGNDLSLKLDYATKEAGAYPINLVTYEIVCSKYKDAAKGRTGQVLPYALRLGRRAEVA
jgi:phosphate transport system substrate-binding protein